MSALRRLAERRAITTHGLSADGFFDALLGQPTASGSQVTVEGARRFIAVYACQRALAEPAGYLPLTINRRLRDGREPVTDLPEVAVLTREANPDLEAGELWRDHTMIPQLGWGNAFHLPVWDGIGRVRELWPIPPESVSTLRQNGRLFYRFDLPHQIGPFKGRFALSSDKVIHYKAFGSGDLGLSPVGVARETIGMGLAAEEYAARFFRNNASPGGVLSAPGELSDTVFNRLSAQWKKLHEGNKNAHKTAILEAGTTWTSIGMDHTDAQFLELRQFSVTEIARLYNVPPHMIQDITKQSSWGAGIEAQGIGFVVFSLAPWLIRLEKTINRTVFRFQPDVYVKFKLDALQRGDIKTRYLAYSIGRQWGFLSVNDIRRLEDMDPIEGGDEYLVPLNMSPADEAGDPQRMLRAAMEEDNKRTNGQVEEIATLLGGKQL